MTELPKLDRVSCGFLAALLALSAVLGIVGITSDLGGPAASVAAISCVTPARIEESAQRIVKLTAAVTFTEVRVAKAKEALAAAENSTTTARARILKGELARANAALTAARASLKAAQTAHARLAARQCTDPGGVVTATSPILVEYVNANIIRMNGIDTGDPDTTEFKINFKVTASGEDIYLDGDAIASANPTAITDGLAWSTATDSTTGTSTYTAIVTAMDGYRSTDINSPGDKQFKTMDGNSRTFTFTTIIPAGTDNSVVGVQLNGFKWGTTSVDVMDNLYTTGISDFRSDLMIGLYIR